LTQAFKGFGDKGLFFRGKGKLPFGDQIRSVQELLTVLLQPASKVA
jgi:nitronate monooxygenase